MIMYVGLLGHSAVVVHVFLNVLLTVCVVVFFFSDILLIYSAANLFNKLIYLFTYLQILATPLRVD